MLKQSTAATVLVGPVLDSTGAAYVSMAIGDFNLTKEGTTAALASTTATHSHEGHYLIALTTGNTDTIGRLVISCNKSTYAMPPARFQVYHANNYNVLMGSTALSTLVAGAQMDLVNSPNATALAAIANKVEAEIIDETDSEKVLTAITNKIAAVNPSLGDLTLAAIGAAVWANASRTLSEFGFTVSANAVTLATSQPNYAPAKAGDAMALTSPYDAAKTAASATNLAAAKVDTVLLLKLLQADQVIDTGVTPWALVYLEAGTGTELMRKQIRDTAGVSLTSTDSIPGRLTQ